MENKVVLITGGSSGIGKSIGTFLSAKGCKVYGTARNPQNYPDFDTFELVQLDVKDTESVKNAVKQVIAKAGRLDVLINNAGMGITGPIEETPHEEILNVFDTNFHGPVHMMKAVLPQMRKQGGGTIINITSIAGYMGLPYRGFYSATKGALGLITEALRMEVKDFDVTVTNIAPGDFATNIAAGRYHAPVLDGSAYEDKYAQTINAINDDVDSAGDPIQVAKAVYKIMQQKKPKVHNPVGAFMQKFSLRLKSLLPDKVYEKLLINHYKL
ncbi:SDR family oxidoreductase [Flagellimonas sediminis]|uniref:SDR family NAD(P)-dependent oxidoreductase n=1 Tax=Flagellimonas sediminis TaxID=2696468 RepID=A0A6I5KT30_9FLAO|nr:SDR family oxidoreductase [Allomuricauda sediminis]NDV44084.1 SDR family NAD(P)-dependent oxidoreductase [Allomuricauda sediminis]